MTKTIKVLSNFKFPPGKLPLLPCSQKDGRWNDLQIVESDKADYYLVCNWPKFGGFYDPAKTIVMQQEPEINIRNFPFPYNSLNNYRNLFLYAWDTYTHYQPNDWFLSPAYSDFLNGKPKLEKTHIFSTVTSARNNFFGHKKRLLFLRELAGKIPIDIFGEGHDENYFPRGLPGKYLGELPAEIKDLGLFPYKYTFAAENNSEPGYFTEKLCDAILSECLCFYWGCPNVADFLDPRAYILIDIDDHEKSFEVIERAIADDEWTKRLPHIRAAKQKILNELQILPTLDKILKETAGKKSRVFINFPGQPDATFFILRVKNKLTKILKRLIKGLAFFYCSTIIPLVVRAPKEMIVIVSFRDREEDLKKFIPYMHNFLKNIKHRIVMIEQAGSELFNKGKLYNIGFQMYSTENAYFCFHDVDLLPESVSCDYSYPAMPTQLSAYCSQFDYVSLPYVYFGGVFLMNKEDFKKINGCSNQYLGWGAEDYDLLKRINMAWTIPWRQKPGRYLSIERLAYGHHKAHENIKRQGNPHFWKNRTRVGVGFEDPLSYDPKTDGLSDLKYELLDTIAGDGYVKHIVKV